MSAKKDKMEDFLRDKMDGFDTGAAPDWDSFEPRLEKALMFQRMKQAALVSIVLIILGIGALYTSNYLVPGKNYTYYQPRVNYNQAIKQMPARHTAAAYETAAAPGVISASENTAAEARPAVSQKLRKAVPAIPAQAAVLKTGTSQNNGITASQGEAMATAEQETLRNLDLAPHLASLSAAGLHTIHGFTAPDLGLQMPPLPFELKKRDGPYISPLQEKNPWSYSLNVYPNFTFRRFVVDPDKRNLLHRDFIDAMQVSESAGMSLNIGFRVSRRIGPITYVNSGLEYISYKTEAYFNFTNFRDAHISPETGEITSYSVKAIPEQISFSDKNVYHYLNIPLSISHQPWASKDIRLNLEAGASLMYFLTASGKTIDYQTLDIIDLSERNYRNSMGSFFVKVGATYHLNKTFNFGFEPTLLYFTNTIYTEEYPFRVIPYSVGMNLKLQVKLN